MWTVVLQKKKSFLMHAACPAYHKQTCSSSDLIQAIMNEDYLFVTLHDVLEYIFSN
jgi:hypothetical protein